MGKVGSKPVQVYKAPENLNARVVRFTRSIKYLFEVNNFLKVNLPDINASFDDQKTQMSLLDLSHKIRKKFDTQDAHDLAFQIQCTALAMIPDPIFQFEQFPAEIQQLIFYEAANQSATHIPMCLFRDFSVSKAIGRNVAMSKSRLVNKYHVSLRELGRKTAKEAIAYAIQYNLTSVNLRFFSHLTDDDLVNLCSNLPDLQRLTITFSIGIKSIEALKKLQHLTDLDIQGSFVLPEKEFVEMMGNKPCLQHLNMSGQNLSGIVDALENLTNLESLNVGGCKQLPGIEFVSALEKLVNLRNLNISDCFQLPKMDLVNAIHKLTYLRELTAFGWKFQDFNKTFPHLIVHSDILPGFIT